MKKHLFSYKTLFLSLLLSTQNPLMAQNPPITPAWALGHIVWEDSLNNESGAKSIVNGYLERNIPVNAVIIDSPWSTAYNNFEWDTDRYPDHDGMIDYFEDKNVKVILWLTGAVNNKGKDTKLQKSESFDYVSTNKLGINGSEPHEWWKGEGIHIDFTNPKAKDWWSTQLDKVFRKGVYGWKVDQGEFWFGDIVDTSKGKMSNELFRPYYYDAMYDYTTSRNKDGIIIARPYSHQGGFAASVEKMNLGWCGDFSGDWNGLKLQIQNIYKSALRGYGAIGCEIAGFFRQRSNKEQFIRYAQFGSMTACLINGGENGAFSNHLPWWHGKDAEKIYRNAIEMHESLVPYFFSTIVDCHLYGGSLIRNTSFDEESHKIGDCLFTKAITAEGGNALFHLPSEGVWIDYFTNERYNADSEINVRYPLETFPLFVKAGSIIPTKGNGFDAHATADNYKNSNGLNILIYPNGISDRTLHLPCGEGIEYNDIHVYYDQNKGLLKIDGNENIPLVFVIKDTEKVKKVKGTDTWNYDEQNKVLTLNAASGTKQIEIKK